MKTPFSISLDRAGIRLAPADRPPFMPAQAMPFVDASHTACFVGTRGQAIYRWHDAFDVFVVVLEASCKQAMDIPFISHLADLHLVYQLQGASNIHIDPDDTGTFPPITLPKGHRMEAYIPPVQGTLRILPDEETHRYALAAMVPKSDWVTRHPTQGDNPMDEIIRHLKQRHDTPHYLRPSPITPAMYTGLHILLTTPAYTGMRLDDALNGSMVSLLEEHRGVYRRSEQENRLAQVADAARRLVRESIARMDSDQPITVNRVALAMQVHPTQLWKAHDTVYHTSLAHYINEQQMEYAKTWLDQGKTVKEVGLNLGYSTPNNFSRSFKKRFGISPDAYRKKR